MIKSAAAEKRKRDQRRATNTTLMVRNREVGEPLRAAQKKCKTCGDQPWRRMGVCRGCGLPYQAERIER